jgi:hypothetical protein
VGLGVFGSPATADFSSVEVLVWSLTIWLVNVFVGPSARSAASLLDSISNMSLVATPFTKSGVEGHPDDRIDAGFFADGLSDGGTSKQRACCDDCDFVHRVLPPLLVGRRAR